jgi:hypothetical protein
VGLTIRRSLIQPSILREFDVIRAGLKQPKPIDNLAHVRPLSAIKNPQRILHAPSRQQHRYSVSRRVLRCCRECHAKVNSGVVENGYRKRVEASQRGGRVRRRELRIRCEVGRLYSLFPLVVGAAVHAGKPGCRVGSGDTISPSSSKGTIPTRQLQRHSIGMTCQSQIRCQKLTLLTLCGC